LKQKYTIKDLHNLINELQDCSSLYAPRIYKASEMKCEEFSLSDYSKFSSWFRTLVNYKLDSKEAAFELLLKIRDLKFKHVEKLSLLMAKKEEAEALFALKESTLSSAERFEFIDRSVVGSQKALSNMRAKYNEATQKQNQVQMSKFDYKIVCKQAEQSTFEEKFKFAKEHPLYQQMVKSQQDYEQFCKDIGLTQLQEELKQLQKTNSEFGNSRGTSFEETCAFFVEEYGMSRFKQHEGETSYLLNNVTYEGLTFPEGITAEFDFMILTKVESPSPCVIHLIVECKNGVSVLLEVAYKMKKAMEFLSGKLKDQNDKFFKQVTVQTLLGPKIKFTPESFQNIDPTDEDKYMNHILYISRPGSMQFPASLVGIILSHVMDKELGYDIKSEEYCRKLFDWAKQEIRDPTETQRFVEKLVNKGRALVLEPMFTYSDFGLPM